MPAALAAAVVVQEGLKVDAALSSIRLEGDFISERYERFRAGMDYTATVDDFEIMMRRRRQQRRLAANER